MRAFSGPQRSSRTQSPGATPSHGHGPDRDLVEQTPVVLAQLVLEAGAADRLAFGGVEPCAARRIAADRSSSHVRLVQLQRGRSSTSLDPSTSRVSRSFSAGSRRRSCGAGGGGGRSGFDASFDRRGARGQGAPQLLARRPPSSRPPALDDQRAARPRARPRCRCATARAAARSGTRPCPRATRVSFSAAARRISHSMAGGRRVEPLAVGVAALRLQEGVGIVAGGQLDHVHAAGPPRAARRGSCARPSGPRRPGRSSRSTFSVNRRRRRAWRGGERGAAGGHGLARRRPRARAPRRGSPPSVRRAPPCGSRPWPRRGRRASWLFW